MTMSKHNGLFGRDTGRAAKSKGWKGLKRQAALALAVSLWIGGAGVASADGGVILLSIDADDSDTVKVEPTDKSVPAGASLSSGVGTTGVTSMTVKGDWTNSGTEYWAISGWASESGENDIIGRSLTVDGGTNLFGVGGATSVGGNVSDNTVTMKNGSSSYVVTGGASQSKNATNNKVYLIDSTAEGYVVGGSVSTHGDATGNLVSLINSEVKGNRAMGIMGGALLEGGDGTKGNLTNNKVSLTNSKVPNVYGGYATAGNGDIVTGNTLDLFGTNTVTGEVTNFETINLKDAVWGKPVLTLSGTGIAQNKGGSYATIDTRGINFSGVNALSTGENTILIKNKMTGYTGKILSGKYTLGTTLEGLGTASLSGDDLIYTIDTGVSLSAQEKTHNTVMGAAASMAALSAGNDFVGAATEGLAMAGNAGADGVASYANMGGGSMDVETGSHVKTHTWNAILALGRKNEKKLSSTEYGAFFEYGKGNYSTINGDERGDGSTHYTGGGILGKWQKNNGFYVEGSLRVGSINDDAHNVLRDITGTPYSYETDATYWGAHVGAGREIKVNKTDALDFYAKYFYNHRGSVSFDAGGHYDLDAVESSVLRVGTRYTVKRGDNINYYGGLAVEHEFCGRASGFADGMAIRGADISGTSVRGEIGAIFRPGKKSNVTLDLNFSGFAGQKRGFTGGLSAVFHI